MKLELNGEAMETRAETLAAVLSEAGFGGAVVATAVNGTFVPAPLRDAHRLQSGDQIEVLAPMQGG